MGLPNRVVDLLRIVGTALLAVALVLGNIAPVRSEEPETSASTHPPLSDKKETRETGYVVGGAVLTVLNIPLRGALCAGSTVLAGGLFIITAGTAVNATTFMVKETCGGPWIITPEMVKGEKSESRTHP